MKVFILADTIYIARISGQCNIVYLCVLPPVSIHTHTHIYRYIYIHLTCIFQKHTDFCKGAKPTNFTCMLHSYMHLLEYVLTDVLQ